jgi:DNA-binding phage protein
MRRNSSFDAYLSQQLENIKFAQGYLLNLIEGEEGLSLEEALRVTIRQMGVKEFCERTQMRKQNVNDFLSEKRNLKRETLDAFLKPFGLRTRVIVEKAS